MPDTTLSRAGPDQRLAGGHAYWPALDGLRALAVAAVLCYHQGFGWARGGFLGVSLFFTLSGFLITTVVLVDHERHGRVRLVHFWARRLRRLAPVALLGLAAAVAVAAWAIPAAQRPQALGDVRAALAYLANWRFVATDAGYFDVGALPSPAQHYWSLAIEEQFYIAFPFLAAVALGRTSTARGRGRLAAALVAIVGLSAWQQVRIDDLNRVYFGADTRAAEIAVGCLLALAIAGRTPPRQNPGRRLADVLGTAALVVTVGAWAAAGRDASVLGGGLIAMAAVSAVVIVGALAGPRLSKLLSTAPLPQVGRASYGLYVFHFPIFLWLSPQRAGIDGFLLFGVRIAVTAMVTAVAYRLVEQPVRLRRRLARPPTARRALALATAGVFALTAAAMASAPPAGPHVVVEIAAPRGPEPIADSSAPAASLAPAPRVLVYGDSTALAIGRGLQRWGNRTGRLHVDIVGALGCAVLPAPAMRVRPGQEFRPQDCDQLLNFAVLTMQESDPDAVVVFHGTSQLHDWRLTDDGPWTHIGDPAFDGLVEDAAAAMLARLGEAGVPVLWADVAQPRWDPDWEGYAEEGITFAGHGPITLNDERRVARLNALGREVASRFPRANYWPFAGPLAGENGVIEASLRPDGVHLDEAKVEEIAEAWLFDALGSAYRDVVERPAAGVAPRRHAWTASGPAHADAPAPLGA